MATWIGVASLLLLTLSSGARAHTEVCDRPLVAALPSSSFRSSSQLSPSHGPVFAKVNRREGAGGWSPLVSDSYQWLDVDLGRRTSIAAVATQGRYGSSDWLTAYLLMFSDSGHNWRQHRQEDSLGALPGNSNADSVVQYKLEKPVIARFLRLVPLDWNPTGRIGLRLEVYGCPYSSDVVHFDGTGALVFRLAARPSAAAAETFTLKFKSQKNSGTLLHAEGHGDHGDHRLSLELNQGRLLLYYQQAVTSLSSGVLLASVGSLLDDQHWHYVKLERVKSHLNLTVDHTTHLVHLPNQLSHWDVHQVSVGSTLALGLQGPVLSSKNLSGCLENLLYNSLNLIELAKKTNPQVSVIGNVTFSCLEPASVAVTFSDPLSFLSLPLARALPGTESGLVTVEMQIRTWDREGLLVTFNLSELGVWLYVSEGRIKLLLRTSQRPLLELSAGSGLSDGQWHSVSLSLGLDSAQVSVDQSEGSTAHITAAVSLSDRTQLHFGGCPSEQSAPQCSNPFGAFQGCMRLLSLNAQTVDLIQLQQRIMGNYSRLQIDMCGIIDRCSPSLCEHGSLCSQTWSSFHCNCSESGYTGATCFSSAYEQSCEAYKHRGNTSGHYHVDVDGSGPVRPQLVFCNITEEQAWAVLQHNNTELTRISPSPWEPQYAAHFHYGAEEEQLMGLINQSEHCEQELSYYCKKSRLLNTPDGSPFSWWVGGPGSGQEQVFWGGAVPGSRQCSCGLQHTCLDPSHYCNCDADREHWTNDSGLLVQKDTLPVRALLIGDVQRPESEAAYMVGPLRCHGDRNFWNAAFFDKETSYLHFPTFHGELNADISFFFKTSSSSGVFLENLGIKDFIRIELRSPSEVVFSLDVGNGPVEVQVQVQSPLNDDRWHRVSAQRNVKEATLTVDQHPQSTRRAPADAHMHLQLNSQLFIGGTASRQKGFLGCLRALQLNGETLDLEQRARVTPGVRAGCPGHCSTYGSLCQNQGLCEERDRGFSCLCGASAFTGAFCHQEVSAVFKASTSVLFLPRAPSESEEQGTSAETLSLSFRTRHSPAMLLYVASYRQHLALLINKQEELELVFRVDSSSHWWRSSGAELCDGQLHSVTINRTMDTLLIQIDQRPLEMFNLTPGADLSRVQALILGRVQDMELLDLNLDLDLDQDPELAAVAAQGFSGCLSAVRFNSMTPLKNALLKPDASIIVSGSLVHSNCASASSANPYAAETTHSLSDQPSSVDPGQPLVNTIRSDSALIGGVIALVIFIAVVALVVTARFLCSRKQTYRTPPVTASRSEDGQEFSLADSQTAHTQSPSEFFI